MTKKPNTLDKILIVLFLGGLLLMITILTVGVIDNRLRVIELEHDVVELKNRNVELQIIINELEEELK